MPDSRTTSSTALAVPALLVANAVLACGPLLVRLARSEAGVGPVAAGFWRLALVLPLLALLTAKQAGKGEPRAERRAAILIAIGAIAFAADLGIWHVGILHTRLANATLLANNTAVLFPLYGFVAARIWPHPRQWLALGLATGGAALLLGRSLELSRANLIGDLACLAAGLCYTLYLIMVDRAATRRGPLWVLLISCLIGGPLLLGFSFALGEPIWPRAWWPLLLLAFGSQLIGQGMLVYGVARASPLFVGLLLLTQPAISAALGWMLYGERLGAADMVGAVLIAGGVLLVRGRGRRALPEEPPGLSSGS